MTDNRDNFSKKTRTDLALRASYLCSLCGDPTVGPSDESPVAVTMVGKAAHICAAAPGGRRYDPSMTPEQRSHIDNGIWLCATCADLIDRDEVRFTVQMLKETRRAHENSRRIGPATNSSIGDIVGFGDIVSTGQIIGSGTSGIRVRLSHFVEGSARELMSFAHNFDSHAPETRFVLLNELGYGGLLSEAPSVQLINGAYEVDFQIQLAVKRYATKELGLQADTGAILTGLPVCIENIEQTLGMAEGTWFAALKAGSRISDLFWRFHGSPWFERLAMMEMIRLASIPSDTAAARDKSPVTPFVCVMRVNRVEVPSFNLVGQKLTVHANLDLEGHGQWSGALSVFISTPEQLTNDRANARLHRDRMEEIEAEYGPFGSVWMGDTSGSK